MGVSTTGCKKQSLHQTYPWKFNMLSVRMVIKMLIDSKLMAPAPVVQ